MRVCKEERSAYTLGQALLGLGSCKGCDRGHCKEQHHEALHLDWFSIWIFRLILELWKCSMWLLEDALKLSIIRQHQPLYIFLEQPRTQHSLPC